MEARLLHVGDTNLIGHVRHVDLGVVVSGSLLVLRLLGVNRLLEVDVDLVGGRGRL